jgi:hypothetical protein
LEKVKSNLIPEKTTKLVEVGNPFSAIRVLSEANSGTVILQFVGSIATSHISWEASVDDTQILLPKALVEEFVEAMAATMKRKKKKPVASKAKGKNKSKVKTKKKSKGAKK